LSLSTIGFVFVADQVLKMLAFATNGNGAWLIPVRNDRTGWELLSMPTPLMILVMSAVAAGAGWIGWSLVRRGLMSPIVLGMILGGSLGNIFDRVALGAVRDFLFIEWLGVFNLADIAIVLGCAVWVAEVFRSQLHRPWVRHQSPQIPR
jgi:lipoprotein signal peptidase